jgi:hypothetical protein
MQDEEGSLIPVYRDWLVWKIFLARVESFLPVENFNVFESFLKTLGLELVLALLRIISF